MKAIFKFLKFLDYLEKQMGGFFWIFISTFGLTLSSLDDSYDSYLMQADIRPKIEVSSALKIPPGGSGQESQIKRKKFDLALHRRLEQHFPDWEQRMTYQKNQEDFYKSAIRKKREIKGLRIKENSNFYTKEELNAINYFHGTGFFQKYQHPKEKPNIFDTRQTFLLKMHDPLARENFLNSFNNK